jgi:hypothetical protein
MKSTNNALIVTQDNQKGYEIEFGRVAKMIFNDYCLSVKNDTYNITEIEFYIYHKNHKDSFVDLAHKNNKNGCWYFKNKNNPKWKRNRIDINVIGNENMYGGILIRGIKSQNKYIRGPYNVLRELLDKTGKTIEEIDDTDVFNNEYIKLVRCEIQKQIKKPLFGVRVGINKGKDMEYYCKPYRYISDWSVLKDGKEDFVRGLVSSGQIDKTDVKDLLGYNLTKMVKRF